MNPIDLTKLYEVRMAALKLLNDTRIEMAEAAQRDLDEDVSDEQREEAASYEAALDEAYDWAGDR